jgi:hypothetical protein
MLSASWQRPEAAPPYPACEGTSSMNAFLSGWILPLAGGVLVAVFDVMLLRQYLQRRKAHQLAWTIGFFMWTVATFMELATVLHGSWTPMLYRFYIVLTVSLVPVLGYGTLRLISRKSYWGWGYLAINAVLVGWFTFAVFTAGLDPLELAKGAVASYAALGPKGHYPRILSAFVSIPASIVLLYGPIVSIFRFIKKSEYAYRVWANVLIAMATLVIAAAGSMAATIGTSLFYLAEFLAAGLFMAGFLLAGTLAKGAAAIKAKRGDAAGGSGDAALDASADA